MFVMMNEARLDVGMQALGCASASFQNALNYARERVQGRHLLAGGKDAPPVPIIQHPDVRRMLLSMKASTEGCRSILYFIGFCEDMIRVGKDPAQKARYQGLIDLLIPIAKGYVSDRAFEVCSQGIQIFGGYGYTKEYPQEQLLRDCKITHIYEGTNGIQAMDLLGRKLGLNKGQPFRDLLAEIRKTIESAKNMSGLEDLAEKAEATAAELEKTADFIGRMAASDDAMTAYSHAYTFMDVTGDTVTAWMLLWRAVVAAKKLQEGAKGKDAVFYEGQIATARFFINTVLPVTFGKMNVILTLDSTATDLSEDAFGGK